MSSSVQVPFDELAAKKAEMWSIPVDSRLNGVQPLFAFLGWDDLRTLEGKLLTIVDASFSDTIQRKAVKDLVRQTIWWHWVPELDTAPNSSTGGMPAE